MATLSERIVAPSEWVRAALAENAIPPEKMVVSGQSASAEFSDRKPRPLEGANRREIVIGFLGRLERYKGADMLVRALELLPPDLPVHLRIAGVGQDARFARRMERAAAKDPRIRLMGLVRHEEVPQFLADIDVLAVPSRYMETGPIVVQEARALGIPVMGGPGRHLGARPSWRGWLAAAVRRPAAVGGGDPVAATDRAEVARLSGNMRRTRSIDDVADDMARLYREIMADRSAAARGG